MKYTKKFYHTCTINLMINMNMLCIKVTAVNYYNLYQKIYNNNKIINIKGRFIYIILSGSCIELIPDVSISEE